MHLIRLEDIDRKETLKVPLVAILGRFENSKGKRSVGERREFRSDVILKNRFSDGRTG